MTRPLARLVTVTATVTLAIAAAGCSSGTSGDSATTSSLSVGFVAEPANLDFTSTDGAAIPQALLVNVYEGLVKLDQDGKVVPLLAESWEVSPDRKTYTFHLRDNATFTNGKKFTADDVVFSINRVKTEWKVSLKSAMDVVANVEKKDDTTAVVTLAKPSNSWLYKMATRIGAMFSRDGVADLANKPVGTGPYKLESWRRGDAITYSANENYWGTKPKVDKVVLKYFKDATALNNALLTGGIDVISAVQAPESIQQFSDTSKYEVIEGTTTGEVVLSFNNSKAPLNDKRVRQAIRYAIDHKALLDTAWAGRGQLIGTMVPPTDPWYEDLTNLYPHDPAKAKDLLTQAGQSNLKLRMRIPNLPYAVASGQVVKSQLAAVGITVDIEPLEFPARWLDVVFKQADYDMSIINHVEPRDVTAVFGNKDYYLRYNNPKVQELFAKADAGTEDEQVAAMKEAARIISEDAAGDFLFLFPNLIVAKKGMAGLPKNVVSESFDLSVLSPSEA
ncbi:ABC transporter substrate-binding protein [Micromonospora sp. NPDC005299]|uniref:ABC transporter substrate-binding protein n=1 Tax=Micromonospora sp. NPDC005299 TaxID=3364231 RepID=UPI0036C83861